MRWAMAAKHEQWPQTRTYHPEDLQRVRVVPLYRSYDEQHSA